MKVADITLPAWATITESKDARASACIEIDGPKAYAAWMAELEAKYHGASYAVVPDQYWLEVAAQCIKLDVHLAIAGSEIDPRVSGKVLAMHVSRSPEHAQEGKLRGRGADVASKGREARQHFAAIRGQAALLKAAA